MKRIIEDIKEIGSKSETDIYIIGEYIREKLARSKKQIYNLEIIFCGDLNIILSELDSNIYNVIKVQGNKAEVREIETGVKIIITAMNNNLLIEELEKRDFTINTIALKLFDNKIIDPFNGRSHLKSRIIQEISEDSLKIEPLRILEGIKIYIEKGMHFSSFTEVHIREYSKNLNGSEVFSKLMDIINCDEYAVAFEVLDQYFVLKNIIPFIDESKTVGKCKYHVEDVFTHLNTAYKIFKDLQYGEIIIKNLDRECLYSRTNKYYIGDILAFATFVHDIGKYKSYKRDGQNISFIGHQITGEEIVRCICKKYNVDKTISDIICNIVGGHMYPLRLFKVRNNIDNYNMIKKEFLHKYKDYALYIIIVSFCDIMATSLYYDPDNEHEDYKVFIEKLLAECKLEAKF